MKKIVAFILFIVVMCGLFVGIKDLIGEIDKVSDKIKDDTSDVTTTSPESNTITSIYKCGVCSATLSDSYYCDACDQQWIPCAVCVGNKVYTPGDRACPICNDSTYFSEYGG